jgi:hypothetical protein
LNLILTLNVVPLLEIGQDIYAVFIKRFLYNAICKRIKIVHKKWIMCVLLVSAGLNGANWIKTRLLGVVLSNCSVFCLDIVAMGHM